jgi:integrase
VAKTGDVLQQPHDVPLSQGTLAILKHLKKARDEAAVVKIRTADCVFPAATREGHMDKPNKATAPLKDALGVQDRGFLHHIRRTVADRMKKDLGIAPWVVEAILGHAQPVLIETYMPSSPLALMQQALEQWSEALAAILRAKGRGARSGKRSEGRNSGAPKGQYI